MGYADVSQFFKDIKAIAAESANADLTNCVIRLENQILEYIMAEGDLKDENRDLTDQIQKLKNDNEFEKGLTIRENYYWYNDESVPYCMTCWDNYHKKIHLMKTSYGAWICDTCLQRKKNVKI